jgi:ABC-type phosphate/phosphonate transport system substrate-binding protein
MKRVITTAVAALALLAFAGAPASAATTKHTRHRVTCKQIKDAIDSGKSSEDVQTELHVTAARVKACTTPTAKKMKAPTAKPT